MSNPEYSMEGDGKISLFKYGEENKITILMTPAEGGKILSITIDDGLGGGPVDYSDDLIKENGSYMYVIDITQDPTVHVVFSVVDQKPLVSEEALMLILVFGIIVAVVLYKIRKGKRRQQSRKSS